MRKPMMPISLLALIAVSSPAWAGEKGGRQDESATAHTKGTTHLRRRLDKRPCV
jgi:hypothetical protein